MKAQIEILHSVLDGMGLTIDQMQKSVEYALSNFKCTETGTPIYFNDVQVTVIADCSEILSSTTMPTAQTFVNLETTNKVMTIQDMQGRISLLSEEMDVNEEENRFMQTEIDTLYAKIDAQKAASN